MYNNIRIGTIAQPDKQYKCMRDTILSSYLTEDANLIYLTCHVGPRRVFGIVVELPVAMQCILVTDRGSRSVLLTTSGMSTS